MRPATLAEHKQDFSTSHTLIVGKLHDAVTESAAASASSADFSEESMKELRPFVEQQLLHSSIKCQTVLYPSLEKIKELIVTAYQHSPFQRDKGQPTARQQPTAFMSYAWPILDIFPKEHWTQRFIVDFGLDCFRLGLNIAIDCLHSRFGPSAFEFMYNKIKDADIIFPIGTQSFRSKMLLPRFVKSMVRHEYEEITSRMKHCEEKQSPHGVMPIQLTAKATEEVFIPPYKTHSVAESFQEMPYLLFLKELSYRLLFYFEHGLKDFRAITTCKLDPTHPLTQIWNALEKSDVLKPFFEPLPEVTVLDFYQRQQLQHMQTVVQCQHYFQRLIAEYPKFTPLSQAEINRNLTFTQETCYSPTLAENEIVGPIKSVNQQIFVRRASVEREISDTLERFKDYPIIKIAITGQSGMGKSMFAINYAHTTFSQKKYARVAYLTGDEEQFFGFFKQIGIVDAADCMQFYNSLTPAQTGDKPKILILVDDVSSFEKIKAFLPLDFKGRNCQIHLLVVSRQGSLDEFNTVHVGKFNEEDINTLALLPAVKIIANREMIATLSQALCDYPLAVIAAICAIRANSPLSVTKYLVALRDYRVVDFNKRKIDSQQPRQHPITESLHTVEKAFGVIFNQIKEKSNQAFTLLGYLCVLNIGKIPIGILVKLMGKDSENDLYPALSILHEQFSVIYCERETGLIQVDRLIMTCYKKLHMKLYVEQSYAAQRAINQEFIDVLTIGLGRKPDISTDYTACRQYNWSSVEKLVDHILLIGSKVIFSFHNREDANLMCDAFFLAGLYYYFTGNPVNVASAILHLNYVLGDCTYPGGNVFDNREHNTARYYLRKILLNMPKNEEAILMIKNAFIPILQADYKWPENRISIPGVSVDDLAIELYPNAGARITVESAAEKSDASEESAPQPAASARENELPESEEYRTPSCQLF